MRNVSVYFRAHQHAYREAYRYLKAGWVGSVITLLVIAVALALPWGLLLASRYANTLFNQWTHQAQIVLYLQASAPPAAIHDLKEKLQHHSAVASVNYISPEMGLAQLARREGFKEVVLQLEQNPLPPVLEIEPRADLSPQALNSLIQQLHRLPLVDQNQINVNSIQQLYTVLATAKRFIYTLACLFGLAVVLIIGNTLRLILMHRMEEVRVMKLVGASLAYTRRPYLYIGSLLGLLGGGLAWSVVFGFFSYLDTPLRQLNSATNSLLTSLQPGFIDSFFFLTVCVGLGWLGAMMVAQYSLRS
ncbi:MAG: ABC transporter permease [Gammaproteobacteria bacterium]|nr:ABC transporter permease [Gammaproteobacteria bacterium]